VSIPISILDLAPIVEGGTAAQALHNAAELARHAEGGGIARCWLGEQHNMTGIPARALLMNILLGSCQCVRGLDVVMGPA
jgi:alkanesulfonate monooxygenase SsuD/methylene tetrahydromethanopterin reductase-like flavin-dependent oxidoreductase (luciferase family)